MSTFEVADSNEKVKTTMQNPLSQDEDASPRNGNLSPVSPKNKSALSNNAALLAKTKGRNLDLTERKWLQDKWFALDKSGDGLLDFEETKGMLRDIKKKMTDTEIVAAFKGAALVCHRWRWDRVSRTRLPPFRSEHQCTPTDFLVISIFSRGADMDSDGCGRVDFDEFYLWFANQDAEQFAHLMSRGAHRQFARSVFTLGITMVLPCTLIVLTSGPNFRVSSFASDPARSPLEFYTSRRALKRGMCLRTNLWSFCTA